MVWIEITRNVLMSVSKLQADGNCLACGLPLGNGKKVRGCHEKCAKATYRCIAAGKTTDEKRVEEGKWLPAETGGRKPSNPVSIELSKN
jgi:hypothetical protein